MAKPKAGSESNSGPEDTGAGSTPGGAKDTSGVRPAGSSDSSPPRVADSKGPIPEELPVAVFAAAADWCECPKFNLDEYQRKAMTDSLNVLTGTVDKRIVSVIVIVLIITAKVITCWSAIQAKVQRRKPNDQMV